ncbi:hypothetical protein HK096_003349 [Nowakowskiella sp. JEL0078]|nr:hypothetical protein HK096_003349 [Nowakowskiella sp. JEL0078]
MSVMVESAPLSAHAVHTPAPTHPSGASLLEALLKRPPTPISAEAAPETTPMVMLRRSTSSGNQPRKRNNNFNLRRNSSMAGHIAPLSPSFVSPGVILEDPEQGYFGHFPANVLPTAPVCRYFALNRCWAGPHCRFTHVMQHGAYITIFPVG